MERSRIERAIVVLRDLAHEERDFPESMATGHGRALLDAACVLEETLHHKPVAAS